MQEVAGSIPASSTDGRMGPSPLWGAGWQPDAFPMGTRTQLELEAVRHRLDELAVHRFAEGLSALQQAEYDALVEREVELLHAGSEHHLSNA